MSVKCGVCGKFQSIDEIRNCSATQHAARPEVAAKPKKTVEVSRLEVVTFATREERDSWIASNPGSRALATNVRRISSWSDDLEKNVSITIETFKACVSR